MKEAKLLDHNDRAFADEFLKVVRTWRFDLSVAGGEPTFSQRSRGRFKM